MSRARHQQLVCRHCGAIFTGAWARAARPANHGASNAQPNRGSDINGASSGPLVSRKDGQKWLSIRPMDSVNQGLMAPAMNAKMRARRIHA